ncbi:MULTISPECIES: hypothetical protein [unclassified Kribbella]|uniref:hypothetical protein n=1 Tax=unclassified Kribbella TaxID=2644121 RepID=UPI00301735F0
MADLQGTAWSLERFGADGVHLREGLPKILWECHSGMAAAQKIAPVESHGVYDNMWRAVHDGIVREFKGLSSAQPHRPRGASYKILIVNGTAIFPLRYAHDAVTKPDDASLGRHVSPTRQSIFAGESLPDPLLPFADEEIVESDTAAAEQIEQYRQEFRDIASEHPVVVVAYASNPTNLHNAYWGDAKSLLVDGSLSWGYRERLELDRPKPGGRRLRDLAANDGRPDFTTGVPQEMPMRPRRSDEQGKAGEGTSA